MHLDLGLAINVGTVDHPISIERLKLVLAKGHVDYQRWKTGRKTKPLSHLQRYLASGKASLVPYDNFSVALVEPILVLDIKYVISETLTLHLYEKERLHSKSREVRQRPINWNFRNIGLRMRVGEEIRDAAIRALREKLKFEQNVHVIFDTANPTPLDVLIKPSSKYPGLPVVQHRVLVACTLLNGKYKPRYYVRRKRRSITSTYEWQPRAVELAT